MLIFKNLCTQMTFKTDALILLRFTSNKMQFLGPKSLGILLSSIILNRLNIQYMRKSTIVYQLKMEYGLWLKFSFIMCTYTTCFLLKSLHAETRSILLLNLSFWATNYTVGNVGTKIQPAHSTSNSSKLRTRSDSNETYIKRFPLKKQFQKR